MCATELGEVQLFSLWKSSLGHGGRTTTGTLRQCQQHLRCTYFTLDWEKYARGLASQQQTLKAIIGLPIGQQQKTSMCAW